MARIIILRREPNTPSLYEQLHGLFKGRTGPHRALCYEYVDVYSEAEIVRTLARWSGPRTAVQEDLIKLLLSGEITETTVVVEFHRDTSVDTSSHPFDDHGSKSIVEP